MKKRFQSRSSATSSEVAFARCLAVIILSINNNQASACYSNFTAWASAADPFIRAHGLSKVVSPLFNKFSIRKKDSLKAAGLPLTEANVVAIGQAILDNFDLIQANHLVSKQLMAIIKSCARNMVTASPQSFSAIEKGITLLRSSELNQVWSQDTPTEVVSSQTMKSTAARLKSLTAKITGDASKPLINPINLIAYMSKRRDPSAKQNAVTAERIGSWPSVPDSYLEEYSRLVKVVNAATKAELKNLCRKTNRLLVPASEFKAALAAKNIPNLIPAEYSGLQFDEEFKAFTAEGRQLQRVPFGSIRMNPSYDPSSDSSYIFKGVDHSFRYTTFNLSSTKKKAKFSKVSEFLDDEVRNRNKWLPDLNNKTSPNRVLACMIELLYSTAARIGGAGNATKGEPTYGLSTLLVKHVQIQPTRVIFDYEGKKKASQYAVYRLNNALSKRVAAILAECIKDRSPDDLVFTERKTLRNGKPGVAQKITAADVRNYLKSISVEVTPHNFRHIAGTKIMRKVIAACPYKKGAKQAEVDKWFNTQLLEAGEVLHHTTGGAAITASTAIANYVDPTLMKEFFSSLDLRAPGAVEKAFKHGASY